METLFAQYLPELIAVISISMLTIIAPGPDFIIVARNSLSFSRRSGVFTALGISLAIWVHLLYTLAGIGFLLARSIVLFSIVKFLGAAYLMYIGYCCLRNRGGVSVVDVELNNKKLSDLSSLKMGFINNMLNPKATLFFLSLFTQLVSATTPIYIQVVYGAIVSLSCLIWFSLVSVILNRTEVKRLFLRIQSGVEKIMGAVLLGFGIKVALSSTE